VTAWRIDFLGTPSAIALRPLSKFPLAERATFRVQRPDLRSASSPPRRASTLPAVREKRCGARRVGRGIPSYHEPADEISARRHREAARSYTRTHLRIRVLDGSRDGHGLYA